MVTARRKAHNKDAEKPQSAAAIIHKHMTVADVVTLLPEAEKILAEYGLHCFNCSIGGVEMLEDGCKMHGFEDEEIDELVSDLNDLINAQPERTQTLTITAPAARAIRGIAGKEGRTGQGLVVTADGRGGFCLEFRADAAEDERIFQNNEEPDVKIFASALTLNRIGGATIDFRDERFKLDLPEDGCACGNGQNACACASQGQKPGVQC